MSFALVFRLFLLIHVSIVTYLSSNTRDLITKCDVWSNECAVLRIEATQTPDTVRFDRRQSADVQRVSIRHQRTHLLAFASSLSCIHIDFVSVLSALDTPPRACSRTIIVATHSIAMEQEARADRLPERRVSAQRCAT